MVPTGNGKQPVGGKPSKAPLPPAATAALGEADPVVAQQLTEIATSSAYGAPATARRKSGPTKPALSGDRPSTGNGLSVVTHPRSVSTLGIAGDDPVIIALVAILGISTVAMVAAARAERRRADSSAARPIGK
jgi:hypothetical protein